MNQKLLTKLILVFSKTSLLGITSLVISLQPSLGQPTAVNRLPTTASTLPPAKNRLSQTPPENPVSPTPTPPNNQTPTPTPPENPVSPTPPENPVSPTPTPPNNPTPTPTPPENPISPTPPENPVSPTPTPPTTPTPRTTPSPEPITPRTTPSPEPITPRTTPSPEPITPPRREPASKLSPVRLTPNYVGIGGNIGLGGDTTLGESAFTIFSKIGLTNNFSFRPAVLLKDDAVILVPVTFDYPLQSVTDFGEQRINFVPYIGAGAAISTSGDSNIGFLLTGGVDVRLSPEFTANAGLNVGFLDDTDVGLRFGIGYNF